MKGLAYDKKTKSWKSTTLNSLSSEICRSAYRAQSRDGHLRSSLNKGPHLLIIGGEKKQFDELGDAITWVEENCSK